jgi:amino acid transporter/nucleotide-binding universal stress UspA family protein
VKKFETEVRLSREMSLMDATLIGVGAMIGAGIFVLTGIAAGVAGPALILTFALNGVVALFTAMSYAELGSCFHDAGGGYLWVKEGLPKWNGFISGWMSWFAHAVACSLYAIGFGAYFELVFHELGVNVPEWAFLSPQKLLAAAVAILFAYVNYRGASETGKIGNLVTITKIAILAVFIGFGLKLMFQSGDYASSFSPFMPNGWGGVFKAMGLTFIAFEGFEVIAQSSEEIRNPRKNIPRAVFLSLVIVVPIYLLVAVTALGAVKPEGMTPWAYLASYKETALVDVARHFFTGGGVLLLFGGVISTMSALNATIYSSSRVAFAMGRDRNFPGFFSQVSSKKFTPHWAILVSLVIVVFMAVSLPVEAVASAADIMFLLLFLQVNLAMIRLRRKRPELRRGFVTPLYPWLSILGIALLLFLAIYMLDYNLTAWIVTVVWVVLGLVMYHTYASKKEVKHIQKVKALERIERKDYRILTCLSNPKSVDGLTSVSIAMAKKHNAEILFLHVIEVHEGQRLMAGLDDAAKARPLLDKAESIAGDAGINSRSIVEVSHRISRGITGTAVEEECNFIIIGRQKQPTFLDQVFSSLMDTILQRSAAEVAVLHGDFSPDDIKTIFIPFAADVHTRLAAEVAPALLSHFGAQLKMAVILDPDAPKYLQDQNISEINKIIEENNLPGELEILKSKDTLRGILRMARDADLVLMGGRTGDYLELLLVKSMSRAITERVKCPVLWVREYEERPSFWTSLLKPYKGAEKQDAG